MDQYDEFGNFIGEFSDESDIEATEEHEADYAAGGMAGAQDEAGLGKRSDMLVDVQGE